MKLRITDTYEIQITKELKSEAMKMAWSYYPNMKEKEIEELKQTVAPEFRDRYEFAVEKEELFPKCLQRAWNQIKARERSRNALSADPREGSKTQQIRSMLLEGKNPQQIVDALELTTVQFVYNQRTLLKKKGILS